MFEERRRCAGCGRVTEWSEIGVNCSDQKRICLNCVRYANLPDPPMNANGQVHPWESMKFLNRINAHKQYDEFCGKEGTQRLLDGCLLINETDHTFAVGSNDYNQMLIGFQSGSYDSIESISINDGVQTKSVQISDGDSGAAGALFGGLVFGPLGAIVGGLGTRENAKYDEIMQTNNVGFTITHKNTSHDIFNVLDLCLNFDFVNYETQRDIYEHAKTITTSICEELLKCVDKLRPKAPTQSVQSQATVSSTTSSININPSNLEPTITRIELFLEDKEWDKVKDYVNAALDYFPTDYRLYLFLLFAELEVSGLDELASCNTSFTNNGNYKKVMKFANDDIKSELTALSEVAISNEETENSYLHATELMNDSKYEEAYNLFVSLGDYKDSKEKSQACATILSDLKDRNNQLERTIKEKEEEANIVSGLISERNALLDKIGSELNDDINNQIGSLETELLSIAEIVKCSDDSYLFKGFDCRSCRRLGGYQMFNGNNEWIVIGREKNKILLLSRYSEMDDANYSSRKESSWEMSYMNRWLNVGNIKLPNGSQFTFVPMLKAFTEKQQSVIGKIEVLSSNEVEKYLPNKEKRTLLTKEDENIILEWALKDNVLSNMLTIVNKVGEITKVKNTSFMGGTYTFALRPAIWLDLTKLIPEQNDDSIIKPNDPNYKYIEYEGYSLYVPEYFYEKKEPIPKGGGILLTNTSTSDMITIFLSDEEGINDKEIHPSALVSNERIETEEGLLHIVEVKNPTKFIGYVQAHYRPTGEKEGLSIMAVYTLDGKHNYGPDLKKGFKSIRKIQ